MDLSDAEKLIGIRRRRKRLDREAEAFIELEDLLDAYCVFGTACALAARFSAVEVVVAVQVMVSPALR